MITLKEALKLSKDEILALRKELKDKILKTKDLGAYIEQLTGEDLNESGSGIPIAIKDNIQVKNWSVTSASNILQGYVAPYDATVITKLRSAGFAPFGRTNMDEFAMGSTTESSFYGKTLNPTDYSRVPGGSSGGSAAAVAAGIAVAALGSDTGGSIRQPAAFCGCVGFKPTYGRVSRYGLAAYSSSLDQIGPITQNVTDAAILFDVIAGYDKMDSTSYSKEFISTADKLNSDRKLTIAVIENFVNETKDEVKSALLKTIEKLKSAGHKIIYKNLLNSKYNIAAYYIIATAEASTNLSRYDGVRYGNRAKASNLNELYANTRSAGFGEEVQRRMLLGTFVLSSGYYDAYYIKAQKARAYIKKEYEKILDEADLIFMPIAPSVAYKFGELANPLDAYLSDVYTIGVNLAGLPAISVPIAKNSENLNISAQLIGRAYDEQTVLDGALNLEKIIKG
ncbi:Asp-tRNA(Asn)/Glu-tRNA(Gln) amidotransferase subunit GatA [Campylobacter hominis]|uniref:Glutamyl-tRNA(Gln) amidotransferase subunit A n=1 Tax=Campylobacter hominis (strain ATCC BAA-381 / DSM 21671 / CCUG 45161 / LMG 19568 / NCTC 13146 / CH001A) TaxID=360107 RepID=GATA_CAMHC|nr:Asp-tRNA(Asn)/Glu-tRNA(Gln) amidotransferase subunit GatA [Campylobacter hominis]A7I1S8.1 RecName: Full=Glutamyl-tRNA(Gln) amidotransferase subunit A; Short=Glu-ADT subunit A [Campylobacter hominis ATCC BAA-381]ABS52353.1 glutamyl-tRNA(Gln) amidotransferase subunit A (Glu-ADTsubunit A) [Campylobacter hominis ATCC BAA-381]UAK86245.1 Asp-tRNA(Asn)/Glu-tRNA(Gln) amidotransferase subunit GatA [Campylobacter hominis]SUW85002.1 aspartyl/glutamyl-tRNA amidotransferase subunit A [Campylobacter homin